MHSKDEPLFRVGGCYKNHEGTVVRLLDVAGLGVCSVRIGGDHDYPVATHPSLEDGRSALGWRNPTHFANLIPGECDEQGNPIDSDGLCDALSEQAKHLKPEATEAVNPAFAALHDEPVDLVGQMDARVWAAEFCRWFPGYEEDLMVSWFANAIMAGFDEAQRRARAEQAAQYQPCPTPTSTAHPPIAGLMRENGFSHKLGSANLGKCA